MNIVLLVQLGVQSGHVCLPWLRTGLLKHASSCKKTTCYGQLEMYVNWHRK